MAHQAFDSTACDRNRFALQLPPDLVCPINPKIGFPNSPDMRHQIFITAGAGTAKRWVTLSGGMAPVSGWGNLQQFADRLDPEPHTVFIDEL